MAGDRREVIDKAAKELRELNEWIAAHPEADTIRLKHNEVMSLLSAKLVREIGLSPINVEKATRIARHNVAVFLLGMRAGYELKDDKSLKT